MMEKREHKYRFWLYKDKKMYRVLSISDRLSDEDFNRVFIQKEISPGYPANYKDGIDGMLMQFTGLVDKNGKEIYEKDLVNVWTKDKDGFDYTGQIIWDDGCFFVKFPGVPKFPFATELYKWCDRLEIIGNIYERPALLTPQK